MDAHKDDQFFFKICDAGFYVSVPRGVHLLKGTISKAGLQEE